MIIFDCGVSVSLRVCVSMCLCVCMCVWVSGWGASECVGVRKGVGVGCNRTCVSRGRWKDKWNNMRLIRQGRTANLSMCVCECVPHQEEGSED